MEMLRHLKNRKVLAGIGAVAALLAVALWPSAVPVDTATVTRGPLEVTVDEEGETRVRERYVVSAPVPGEVLRIELEPGDAVKRGAVVATVRPAPPVPLDSRARAEAEAAVESARARVGQAQAERKRAEPAVELARSELARQRDLFGRGIVSQQALDAAVADERAAQEALRAAEFAAASAADQLAMARARLLPATGGPAASRPVECRSPVDGVVLKRLRESQSVVAAGEPLLEVGDPARLEIVSDLLSTDAVRVTPGAEVHIEQWGGDRVLKGRVRRVEPSGFMKVSALGVEEQRVNVVVDFADPAEAWRELGDGYRVEIRVVVWQANDAVKVPTSSLVRRGDDWAVFVADAGRARLRVVDVGHRNAQEAEVRSGVSSGQAVVVHPADAVEDGGRIVLR
jgi:HlyD family secretion protein